MKQSVSNSIVLLASNDTISTWVDVIRWRASYERWLLYRWSLQQRLPDGRRMPRFRNTIFCCSVDRTLNEGASFFLHTRQVLKTVYYWKEIESTTSLTNRCDAVVRLIGISIVRSSDSVWTDFSAVSSSWFKIMIWS